MYHQVGEVEYKFIQLTPLYQQLAELPPREKYEKTKDPIQYEFSIDAPLKLVHKLITEIDLKPIISENVLRVDYNKKQVPRVGTLHQCILPSGYLDIRATDHQIKENERIFAERIENFPIFKKANVLYSMTEQAGRTFLKIDLHIQKNGLLDQIKLFVMRPLLKNKFKKGIMEMVNFAENVQAGKATLKV